MMFRTSVSAVFVYLFLFSLPAFAQTAEVGQDHFIRSKPIFVIIGLPDVKRNPRLGETTKKPEKAKGDGFSIAFDFPVYSPDVPHFLEKRIVIDSRRITDSSIGLGASNKPWEDTRVSRYKMVPRVNLFSTNFRAQFNGGVLGTRGDKREIRYLEGSVEYALWMILVGSNGFVEKERLVGILEDEDFRIDFNRASSSGGGFLGFKLGSFQRSFMVAKIGRGYVWTKAEERYQSAIVSDLAPLEWYDAEFLKDSISVEGRVFLLKRLAPSLLIERNNYKKISTGDFALFPLQVDGFQELAASGTLEIVPSLKFGFIRLLVNWRKDFRKSDNLLFISKPPELQVCLRIKF